ncbi:HD domain-containing phosphohydrolase [Niveispirillum sp. KHB5.9]|uniref:HD domain-containing phosphohydrolase n=1 Tax=Niveispirillum sp. KHB5.9 TaxID=3400269 RepID=UPI003A845810
MGYLGAQIVDSSLSSARVLVIDDMQISVDYLVCTLRRAGLAHVSATTDPREGLNLCRLAPPDLILLDYCMPGLDGPGFMAELTDLLGDEVPPILIITAHDIAANRRRALEMGAIDYVLKPFTDWELLIRARNLLRLHMLHRSQRAQSKRLEQLVRERTAELERTRAEIIHRLCNAGEFRDEDTGRHVARIGRLSSRLAELAGEGRDFAERLAAAAPLHDIGKIGIPDRVLLKPGKLDPDEWAIMKTHCTLGSQILADSGLPLLDLASEVALTHHEKWDGSGYPNALAGDDIPLSGRLVAVCDVFDALLSHRPYKDPWPMEKALAYIGDVAGTHLDPRLARLFLDNKQEMINIRVEMAD